MELFSSRRNCWHFQRRLSETNPHSPNPSCLRMAWKYSSHQSLGTSTEIPTDTDLSCMLVLSYIGCDGSICFPLKNWKTLCHAAPANTAKSSFQGRKLNHVVSYLLWGLLIGLIGLIVIISCRHVTLEASRNCSLSFLSYSETLRNVVSSKPNTWTYTMNAIDTQFLGTIAHFRE